MEVYELLAKHVIELTTKVIQLQKENDSLLEQVNSLLDENNELESSCLIKPGSNGI